MMKMRNTIPIEPICLATGRSSLAQVNLLIVADKFALFTRSLFSSSVNSGFKIIPSSSIV